MTTHKVIDTDNFAGDYPNQKHLCWVDSEGKVFVLAIHEESAKRIAAILNLGATNTSPRYHMIKPIDYVLQGGFEP